MDKYGDEVLKLSNQICFPLYASGKEIVRRYQPYLEKLDLTYTQYIVLMVLWEKDSQPVNDIAHRLIFQLAVVQQVQSHECMILRHTELQFVVPILSGMQLETSESLGYFFTGIGKHSAQIISLTRFQLDGFHFHRAASRFVRQFHRKS